MDRFRLDKYWWLDHFGGKWRIAGRHDGSDKYADHRQLRRRLDDRRGTGHSPQRDSGKRGTRFADPVDWRRHLCLRHGCTLVAVDGIRMDSRHVTHGWRIKLSG